MYIYGAKNSLKAGVVLKPPDNVVFEHCLRLNFPMMNNEAEYETFIIGLRSSKKLLVLELHIFSDSKLVVNQVNEKFEIQGAKMEKYLSTKLIKSPQLQHRVEWIQV